MLKLTYDIEEFRRDMRGMEDEIVKGLAISLGAGMEWAAGQIRSKYYGPRVWKRINKPSGAAFATAIKIAKSEGYSDFSRGVVVRQRSNTKKGTRLKVVGRAFAGAGWRRVIELAPQMPFDSAGNRKFPSGSQKVWHQSGELRKRTDWDLNSNVTGIVQRKSGGLQGPGAGQIAIGYVTNPMEYAQKLETKYGIVEQAVAKMVADGSIQKRMGVALRGIRNAILSRRGRGA